MKKARIKYYEVLSMAFLGSSGFLEDESAIVLGGAEQLWDLLA